MSELAQDLYQRVVLEHMRHPRNFRVLDDATWVGHGDNPLCGDRVTIFLRLGEDGTLSEVSFQGEGCAIMTASASMLTEHLVAKTPAEGKALVASFRAMIHPPSEEGTIPEELGQLSVFSGVRSYPGRVKCAELPWSALDAALDDRTETVSTET